MKRKRFSEEQIIKILKAHEAGVPLADLAREHGFAEGTIYTRKAKFFWSQENGVQLNFIQPGKPRQNAFIESINGRFREGCLDQHWFKSLTDARFVIDRWRQHYNEERPHSSLNYQPPAVFASKVA